MDIAMVGVTIVAAVGLLCAYLGRWISPEKVWIFAFAGMGAPMLYVVNAAAMLYWVMRWRRWAVLPVVVLIIGIGGVSMFFKPTLSRHHNDEIPRGATMVMTYNVEAFEGGVERTAEFIRTQQPDILCLQEYESRNEGRERYIDSLIGPENVVHSYSRANAEGGGGFGVAILSRWKIVDSGEIHFAGTANSAMWADVVAGDDTLRVFNCHLQSTSVSREDVKYVEDFAAEQNEERTRTIAAKLRRSFAMRAMQVDSIAPLIKGSPHRTIVCGDFNDTPMSYAYTRLRGRLKDTFVESGRGVPGTYRGLFNVLRIDHVLHSRGMRGVSYAIPEGGTSDHKPVVAGIEVY